MALNNEQKKRYRSLGHNLKPVVTVASKGLTESVIQEIERALNDHELIKVKLAVADRDSRQALVQSLCEQTGAEVIQEIGRSSLVHKCLITQITLSTF